MNFTGNLNSIKRNFYTQNNNFGISFDFAADSVTGSYSFGVSGSDSFSFDLISGKILKDNLLLGSYFPFEQRNLRLDFTSGSYNVFIDSVPVLAGLIKNTGNYDYFYINRESGKNIEFNLELSGQNKPVYSIDQVGYLFNSGVGEVSGKFKNLGNNEIKVFTFDSFATQDLSYSGFTGSVNSLGTGRYKYIGDFNNFDFTQPIINTLNTNFGQLDFNFSVVNVADLNRFVFLSDIDDYSFNEVNQINRDLYYSNYSGQFVTDGFGTELIIKLDYLSGSGQFISDEFAESAAYSQTLIGNFLQSGLLTGRQVINTGNSDITGQYIVDLNRFQWATGRASGIITGYGTGIASGLGYTGRAVGYITGFGTGLIQDGSGTYLFKNNFTGYGFEFLSLDYPNYTNATGYISVTGLGYGDYFYIGVENIPIVKGLQYNNETGLVFYLSGELNHKVKAYYDGEFIQLEALNSGVLGDGIFVRSGNCNDGYLWPYSEFLTGGVDIGATGQPVYYIPNRSFTGFGEGVFTGSGSYSRLYSGVDKGLLYYTRTFTGTWDLYTGLDSSNLFQVPEFPDYFSGRVILPPNSFINFQIDNFSSPIHNEGATFTVNGSGILNPITQIVSN